MHWFPWSHCVNEKDRKSRRFLCWPPCNTYFFSKVDSEKMRKNPFGQYYALRSNKLTQFNNIFLICTKNRQKMRIIYVVYVQILAHKILRILGAVLSSFLCLQKVNFFSLFPTRAWRKTACLCALNRPWYLVFQVRGGYSYRRRKVNMFCSIYKQSIVFFYCLL